MKILMILGDQLFDPKLIRAQLAGDREPVTVFMREDVELCTRYRFHKHKLIFFLASMRNYAEELRKAGFKVHYEALPESKKGSYIKSLEELIKKTGAKCLSHFEIEDKFFEERLLSVRNKMDVIREEWPSPMFLTSRAEFQDYLKAKKRPFMKTFYEWQRRRLNILVNKKGEPLGGQWSFDEDNRKPLPKSIEPPGLPEVKHSVNVKDVMALVDKHFPDHPGRSEDFWLPTDRRSAEKWLDRFCEERLREFGPYEDALAPHSDFVFHSVLTPFLNVGWITPRQVIDRVLDIASERKVPMNSLEGFVRQVIGWREFVRGIYRNYGDKQVETNFWNHELKLSPHWYRGDTGVPPLDQVIHKTLRYAHAHHIERLMVAGNMMLLLNVHPQEAYRWFMEMFIDSGDWVMVPNLFGMGMFSDGGVFATKPYICGSNYFRKMGGYKAGDWQDGVDGLYWSFIDQNRKFFAKNPRLSMSVKSFDKMAADRKTRLFAAAEQLRSKLTV